MAGFAIIPTWWMPIMRLVSLAPTLCNSHLHFDLMYSLSPYAQLINQFGRCVIGLIFRTPDLLFSAPDQIQTLAFLFVLSLAPIFSFSHLLMLCACYACNNPHLHHCSIAPENVSTPMRALQNEIRSAGRNSAIHWQIKCQMARQLRPMSEVW